MTGRERFLAACRREPVDATPVWFMRQAGGAIPRYLELRREHGIAEIARSPELNAEVSILPVDAFGVDAAVMFADILLPAAAMGVALHLDPEIGPIIDEPIRSPSDIDRLHPIDPGRDLRFILDAIGIVERTLGPRAAVIGIVGAPFTVACYLIEGRPSRDFHRARAFMFAEPEAFARLLGRLAEALADFAVAQVAAGASAIQMFDSWVGGLAPLDYDRHVARHSAAVLGAVRGAPTIHFGTSAGALLERLAAAGGDVIGIDHRVDLDEAWRRLGPTRAIQGNLDPARLLAGRDPVLTGADEILAAAGNRRGHVFNLGHAAPPGTDPALLAALADHVHRASSRTRPPAGADDRAADGPAPADATTPAAPGTLTAGGTR
jgi:uroporphyrinogen decarboxylase